MNEKDIKAERAIDAVFENGSGSLILMMIQNQKLIESIELLKQEIELLREIKALREKEYIGILKSEIQLLQEIKRLRLLQRKHRE